MINAVGRSTNCLLITSRTSLAVETSRDPTRVSSRTLLSPPTRAETMCRCPRPPSTMPSTLPSYPGHGGTKRALAAGDFLGLHQQDRPIDFGWVSGHQRRTGDANVDRSAAPVYPRHDQFGRRVPVTESAANRT